MHCCYILENAHIDDLNKTYNGYTNNVKRRIRQHNRVIKGGAKYTGKYGNNSWKYIAIVSGFPDRIEALRCEWKIKYPTNKKHRPVRYNSPSGRIIGLNEVLARGYDYPLTVWIDQRYAHLVELHENIEIIIVGDFDNIDIH